MANRQPLSLKERIDMATHEFTVQAIMRVNRVNAAREILAAAKTPKEIKKAKKELKMAEKAIGDLFGRL